METLKIKNSNIMKLLEAAPSYVPPSAEGENESEQHVTGKIRKKGTCEISTGMNKKGFRNSQVAISNTLRNCYIYNNRTIIFHIYDR